MNTDGFVKCNGKVLADKAKLYIELIQSENDRLVNEYREVLSRKTDIYHRDRAAACDYAQSQAMTDLQAILEPYFVNKTVQHGMLWWYRETIESNLDLRVAIKDHKKISSALVKKYPNLWGFLPHNWQLLLPNLGKVINAAEGDRLHSKRFDFDYNWNYRPLGWMDISSLHQLIALDDTDVFLSIQNYNVFIAAADRYDELMQRKLETLDASLHQSN